MFVVDFLFRVLIALFSDQLASLSNLSAPPLPYGNCFFLFTDIHLRCFVAVCVRSEAGSLLRRVYQFILQIQAHLRYVRKTVCQ